VCLHVPFAAGHEPFGLALWFHAYGQYADATELADHHEDYVALSCPREGQRWWGFTH
jgi:hypothetical protein